MRPRVLNISPYAAANDEFVAASQQPAAGGVQELTLTADPVVMDFRRQVEITSNGDDSDRRFLIEGTDEKGNFRQEALVGPNSSTVSTVQAFTTVTAIKIDGDSTGLIESGTGSFVSSNWLPLDYLVTDFQVALGLTVHPTVVADVTVELTLSNILDRRGNDPQPTVAHWFGSEFDLVFPEINIFDHDSLVNETASGTGNIAFPVRAIRLTSNAVMTGSADGVDLEVIQASHRSS